MPLQIETPVLAAFIALFALEKSLWRRAHTLEVGDAVTLTWVVAGSSGAWAMVDFHALHTRNFPKVNLKGQKLVFIGEVASSSPQSARDSHIGALLRQGLVDDGLDGDENATDPEKEYIPVPLRHCHPNKHPSGRSQMLRLVHVHLRGISIYMIRDIKAAVVVGYIQLAYLYPCFLAYLALI